MNTNIDSPSDPEVEEGPGWMPALMAGTVMMGIMFFVCCGFTTWLLFQKRTEMAIRTLRGTLMPSVEQSLINPEEKKATLVALEELTKDLERGKYEQWQASGVLTRLIRAPILQWGDLEAVDAFIKKNADSFAPDALVQTTRLRWGVEMDELTAVDFDYVLEPVTKRDDSLRGETLHDPLGKENVAKVIGRAKEVSDRADIENKQYDRVFIDGIVKREIKAGIAEGSM